MGMILRIASSRIVGQGDIVGRSGYFSLNLSANSVMRGRLDARRTLKSLVADLRFINIALDKLEFGSKGEIKELQVDSNAEWEVADIPEWCEAIAKDRGKLILKVGKTKKAREGTLIVKSKGGKISSIILSQKKGGLF